MSLLVDGMILPQISALDVEQQYEMLATETILRAVNGRGIKQMTYGKLRVTTSGSGWLPLGLDGIDYSITHVLGCVTPKRVPANFAARAAILPAARRSDSGFTPFGTALVGGGQAISTPVTMVGNVATCAAVAGAIDYMVSYYPAPTVWLMRPHESGNQADASYRWELVAEEV